MAIVWYCGTPVILEGQKDDLARFIRKRERERQSGFDAKDVERTLALAHRLGISKQKFKKGISANSTDSAGLSSRKFKKQPFQNVDSTEKSGKPRHPLASRPRPKPDYADEDDIISRRMGHMTPASFSEPRKDPPVRPTWRGGGAFRESTDQSGQAGKRRALQEQGLGEESFALFDASTPFRRKAFGGLNSAPVTRDTARIVDGEGMRKSESERKPAPFMAGGVARPTLIPGRESRKTLSQGLSGSPRKTLLPGQESRKTLMPGGSERFSRQDSSRKNTGQGPEYEAWGRRASRIGGVILTEACLGDSPKLRKRVLEPLSSEEYDERGGLDSDETIFDGLFLGDAAARGTQMKRSVKLMPYDKEGTFQANRRRGVIADVVRTPVHHYSFFDFAGLEEEEADEAEDAVDTKGDRETDADGNQKVKRKLIMGMMPCLVKKERSLKKMTSVRLQQDAIPFGGSVALSGTLSGTQNLDASSLVQDTKLLEDEVSLDSPMLANLPRMKLEDFLKEVSDLQEVLEQESSIAEDSVPSPVKTRNSILARPSSKSRPSTVAAGSTGGLEGDLGHSLSEPTLPPPRSMPQTPITMSRWQAERPGSPVFSAQLPRSVDDDILRLWSAPSRPPMQQLRTRKHMRLPAWNMREIQEARSALQTPQSYSAPTFTEGIMKDGLANL
eukprot:gnl/MRDRNA2_/MRDRNA2_28462_c0_seq1.p1 gnl/MRDRNA2_/MRDRNA2_28462_c0~~gnl/MRDRNA2_/MRDRNA2_28462_c0_seq1.p1  ORF type:complete len:681 (-),score=125.97 gnl/MRDRNA2_/MRDRNA2_28462_c0_seq1:78-2093(-)